MREAGIQLDLLEVFGELSRILLNETDHGSALKAITDLGRVAFGSQVCTLTFVDLEGKHSYNVATSGVTDDLGKHWAGPLNSLVNRGDLDLDLIAKGEPIERSGGQGSVAGAANQIMARTSGLPRILAYPLCSGGRLLGYLSHFWSKTAPFTSAEKKLLEIFARYAVIAIERMGQQSMQSTLAALNSVSGSLLSLSPSQFLQRVAEGACELLSASTCVIWEEDLQQKLRVAAATADVDDEYRQITLDPEHPTIKLRSASQQVVQIDDVTAPDAPYEAKEQAKERGWVSMLTVPIYVDFRLTGMIDVYTRSVRRFTEWEKEAFSLFAKETALSLHHLEKRVEELNRITQEMTLARDEKELFDLMLRRALELTGCARGWVSQLNVRTGELEIKAQEGDPAMHAPLRLGRGVTGRALQEERPFRVTDVHKSHSYIESWPDTRSELAVPILIQNADVRVGRAVTHGSKRIGVLNVESSMVGAFSSLDEDQLFALTCQAAIILEGLETDRKLARLSMVERQIVQKQRFDLTVQHILSAITDTLGYEFVNISIVDDDRRRIRSKYVAGLPQGRSELFRRLADHPLDAKVLDIHADIVRSREIEVPGEHDPRFDSTIYKEFNHHELIRVFVPMVSPLGSRVIGTIEAGYRRSIRPYIYERDVRVLNDFVGFVTAAFEQMREESLESVLHEFRAPAAAIRSNVSFLKSRLTELSEHMIQRKLDDLALDSELVLLQVSKVESLLGGISPVSRPRRTIVYRDIIIKTLNQLKPHVVENGFDPTKIKYNIADIGRMILYVDPWKLNQVVFNLLINAIKYATKDPASFAIQIEVDETRDQFIIKVKDWGIGVREEFTEAVFELGFRAPEARETYVTGSGMGLTISRALMREIGGDLKLTHNHNPTEFDVILPKKLKERPDDGKTDDTVLR